MGPREQRFSLRGPVHPLLGKDQTFKCNLWPEVWVKELTFTKNNLKR